MWLAFCERSAEVSFGLWISLPKIYFKHKVCLRLFLSQRCFIILAQLHLVLLVRNAILHTDRS